MIKNLVKKISFEEWIGLILLAGCLPLLAAAVRLCFGGDIWYDELFTVGFAGQSFRDLISDTARDVHPPFYYIYVKTAMELCKLIIPSADPAAVGKLCSVLPFLLLLVYAVWKVRKYFGMLCAGIFSFCVLTMPQLSPYMTEIRMYGLSLFLVTAMFLHACGVMIQGSGVTQAGGVTQGSGVIQTGGVTHGSGMIHAGDLPNSCVNIRENEKKGGVWDWVLFTVYGILAVYTHYFACVAAAVIYLCLLIWYFIKKPGGGFIKKWGLCAGITFLCYLPWLFAVAAQVRQVKESYWILPLTLRSIGGCVKFLLKPSFANGALNVAAAVLLFLLYGFLLLHALLKERERKWENFIAVSGLAVLLGLAAFGFAASFLLRPVFIYRYMLPGMGTFWLCFSILLSRFARRRAELFPALAILAAVGASDFQFFQKNENWKTEQMALTEDAVAVISPEDAVLFNFDQVQGVVGWYLENDTYLWMDEPEALIGEMFDHCLSVRDAGEIRKWLRGGRAVWFIGSGNAREDVIAQWKEEGMLCAEQAECMLERYWFKLYRLQLEK